MKFLMAQRSFNSVKDVCSEFLSNLKGLAESISMKLLCWFRFGKEKESLLLKRIRKINRPVWTENESLSFLCLFEVKKRMKSVSWRTVLWNPFFVKRLEIIVVSLFLRSKTHLLNWIQQRKNWNNFMLSMLLELLSLNWKFVAGFLCWIIKKANEVNCFRNLFFEKRLCPMEGNHVCIAFLIVTILSKNKLFRMKSLADFELPFSLIVRWLVFALLLLRENWLQTISQKQISSTIVLSNQTV